ncbi:hypothetical protein BESB_030220 [Besnoitia besnoiti]|uniref:Uncharacterized protein n=1 Tax=Besnoitia besnoiti TaxID=94643 RepID=A0A2A9LXD5_BESBE|nr:hypothetical protein BESB_030220 [Besnoitia besnoiti]PFH31148.1 hypothetical protein BESB_030220 [Besnoitia besnoiti]
MFWLEYLGHLNERSSSSSRAPLMERAL